ncbi:MAG: glucose/arabinose dehydrogenase [Kiritimatiellia bacterium]|jgi:glucose/arabinose dehydrogenase
MKISPRLRYGMIGIALVGLIGGGWVAVAGLDPIRRLIVGLYPTGYAVPEETEKDGMQPIFDGPDSDREHVKVHLQLVGEGFGKPTDIQFIPGWPRTAVILDKSGTAWLLDVGTGSSSKWFTVDVVTASEQGLLGLAFDSDFVNNGRFYVNYTPASTSPQVSRVECWTSSADLDPPTPHHVVIEVEQPYQNHNAGQLVIGPDSMLYVGWGDGGFRDDPQGNGQNGKTMLGSILRLDVSTDEAYKIPKDNPFLTNSNVHNAAFAIGVRNPWRMSFSPQGYLIVADVGQDAYEEIDVVHAGANLGWPIREGWHCTQGGLECGTGLLDPVWEYGRQDGASITGGYVYTGQTFPKMQGQYVYADFVSGRLWSQRLSTKPGDVSMPPTSLGRWPILPSTFGRDITGEVYVADFGRGKVYRIATLTPAPVAPPPQ